MKGREVNSSGVSCLGGCGSAGRDGGGATGRIDLHGIIKFSMDHQWLLV